MSESTKSFIRNIVGGLLTSVVLLAFIYMVSTAATNAENNRNQLKSLEVCVKQGGSFTDKGDRFDCVK